ncbi:glycosyltransferase [Pseudoalteromonas sp. bablab_jr011]|uniref:glycosyltransferase n=1 Tax=Pseudoalteromonas sp. bablab_jr011 TaxID=2755062 RepID=UPI0018F66AD8|nr:glycosyltransferase [Pseudoalteromonas sp. bablab_jr011]
MTKIVHIINAMEIGGVEVGVLNLLKSKAESNYHVITVGDCNSSIYNSLSEDEKQRLHIGNSYFKSLLLLFKLDAHLVVSSLWRAHFVSLLYKMLKPSSIRFHFVHSARFAHLVDKVITKISIFLSYRVICDSQNTQLWLDTNFKKTKSHVVPMNVSFSEDKIIFKSNPISFVFVGRFSKEKDIIKAFTFILELAKLDVACTYDLYGRDDGELGKLIDFVNQHRLSDVVKFHSSILPTDIEVEMRKYNYYLQSSHVEGMAISVFQSIKNGLLPVVTPVGEIKSYAVDGVNAFYLDVNNLNETALKFKTMIENKEIEKLKVGHFVNESDYPVFDKSFFKLLYHYLSK